MAPIVDRICSVSLVSLCPQMDIIAYVTNEGALVINRTTSWQRLMSPTVSFEGAITSLCWSPDGKRLATGHANGSVRVIDVEQEEDEDECYAMGGTGAMRSPELENAIQTMTWTSSLATPAVVAASSDPKESIRMEGAMLAAQYLERGDKLMPRRVPIEGSVRGRGEDEDERRDKPPGSLSLLVSIDASGQASLLMEGIFVVAVVSLSDCFPEGSGPSFPRRREAAKSLVLSSTLNRLVLWGHPGRLSTLKIGAIPSSRFELDACTKHYLGCSTLLEDSRDALATARQKYAHVLHQIDSTIFDPYAEALAATGEGGGTFVDVGRELWASLATGIATALEGDKLFGELVPGEIPMLKLHKQLDASLAAAEEALDLSLLPTVKRLFYRASELEAFAACGPACGADQVGLECRRENDDNDTARFFKATELFAIKAARCVEEIRDFRTNFALLCAWLADASVMASFEGKPGVKSVPKTPRHCLKDLADVLRRSTRGASSKSASDEDESSSIVEMLVLGPSRQLSKSLCDLESVSDEAQFLLGGTNGYDRSSSRRLAIDPKAECDDDDDENRVSLCGRLRDCCEFADRVFGSVRDSFASRVELASSRDVSCAPGTSIVDVALHARIDDDVICVVATDDRRLWVLGENREPVVERCIEVDAGVLRVGLYGPQSGYKSQYDNKIVVVLENPGEEKDRMWLISDDDDGDNDPMMVSDNSTPGIVLGGDATVVLDDDSEKLTSFLLRHNESNDLLVAGCRGVAAVISNPNFLAIYDLEDVSDDEEDEEEEEDEENMIS